MVLLYLCNYKKFKKVKDLINNVNNFGNALSNQLNFDKSAISQEQHFTGQQNKIKNEENKNKIPSWAKLLIIWGIADIIADLTLDFSLSSWLKKKFKK